MKYLKIIYAALLLWPILFKKSEELEVPIPRLKFFFDAALQIAGKADTAKWEIRINLAHKGWRKTLLHELRHLWQAKNYGDIASWCMNHPEYMKGGEFYRMCPIEVDAEYYARHHGRIKMNPMDVIRLSTLNEAEEHGAITEILARLSMVFGDPMF
nr:MAG TPA: protein of unknown function (DUF4157) [Caudoviricetes sp.]